MYNCPLCRCELSKVTRDQGVFWSCDSCDGRLATVVQLRKTIEKKFIDQLWIAARNNGHLRKRACPGCERPMVEVPVAEQTDDAILLVLDVCTTCQFVWFDPAEYQSSPEGPPREETEKPMSPEAREALALGRIEFMSQRARLQDFYHGGSRFGSVLNLMEAGFPPGAFLRTMMGLLQR